MGAPMSMRSVMLWSAAFVGLLALPATGRAQTLGELVKISGGTPFANCTADKVATHPGTNFAATEVEPWIAVDPTRAGHLLTGVQQDRWSDGGSRGLRAGVSFDGGKHWSSSLPRGTSACVGGPYERSTDPWTAIGGDGTAYFFSLPFNDSNTINGAAISRSTDGGLTWQKPVTLIRDTDPLAFNDKNSMTADPLIPGNAYAVWDRLYGPASAFEAPGGSDDRGGQGAAAAQGMSSGRVDGIEHARRRLRHRQGAQALASVVEDETFGPTYFSRTTDSGLTWTRAVPIYDPGVNAQTIGNVIVVQPSGELLDFFTLITADGFGYVAFVRSQDHGLSWTTTAEIASELTGDAPVTPDSQQPMRTADIIFSVANNAQTGALYVVMQKASESDGLVDVVFLQSTDDGKHWTKPVAVNRTPPNAAQPLRGQAFNGTVASAADGTLVVTYYDFRRDTGVGGEFADVWAVLCKPDATTDCARKAGWGREMRLTRSSFDILGAPLTGSGYFLGDYFGLVAQGDTVWPAFTTVVKGNQTALWTRPITLAP